MKSINLLLVVMAAVLIAIGLSGNVLAFHDGGVAHCDGCHTMHNSLDGAPNAGPDPENGDSLGTVGTGVSTWLTKGTDPSSTCLNCHQGSGSYHIFSTDGSNFTGGGDFYWITKTFSWTAHGRPQSSEADDHGHNVVAADFDLAADATLTTAPGGSFVASNLGCNSCHDPHGQIDGGTAAGAGAIEESGSYGADPTTTAVGNYRLLGDTGYDGGEGGAQNFTGGAPIATSPSLFAGGESDSNHVAYGVGMSEWCANCHTGFTADSSNPMKHPASNDAHLGTTLSGNYGSYVKTGDFTGTLATSYLAFVPFETGVNDPTALSPSSTAGPSSTANVACVTCHRAHASAFQNATRWDVTTEFLALSHPNGGVDLSGGDEGDDSDALDKTNSYQGRDIAAEFGMYQRSLCNKCHVQD